MKYLLSLIAIVATLTLQASNVEPLERDPQFRVGSLENGLTYYIRPCDKPSGHAEFYIVHNVGSLQEEDNQQGLAHFLEHMAFNGTKNFEGKNFLNYFAGIGVKFGSNINAYTSKDRTVYNISSVPTERRSVIDSTILALHDWSSFISCEHEEIEAERGVVREEWRRSDDAKMRMMKAIWGFEQQGSKFGRRDVLGDIDIINNFSRNELIDYYHKWYRPDLQAVIIVGDIDTNYVEEQIKSTFNKIPKAVNPAHREVYTIEDHQEPTIGYFIDKDAKAASVRMSVKIPYLDAEQARSKLYIEDEMMNGVLMSLIKSRYAALSKVENPKLRIAIPVTAEVSYYGRTITITAIPLNDDYNSALEALLEEYERIERYGFSQIEVAKAINTYRMSLNQKNNQTQTSSKYVDLAVENYTRNRPLISHEDYCSRSNSILDSLDAEAMNNFTKKVWGDKNRTIVYCGGTKHTDMFMPREDVISYVKEVKDLPMEPFVMDATKGPEFRKIEKYAHIESREFVEKFNAEHAIMSNGLEIYWRKVQSARYPIEINYVSQLGVENSPLAELNAVKTLNLASSYTTISAMPKSQQDAWLDEQGIMLYNRVNSNNSRLTLAAKSQEKLGIILNLIDGYTSSMELNSKDFDLFKRLKARNMDKERSEFEIFNDSLELVTYQNPISINELSGEQLEEVNQKSVERAFHRHFGDISNSYLFILSTSSLDDAIESLNSSFNQEVDYNHQESKETTPTLEYSKGQRELHFIAKELVSTKAQLNVTYTTPSKYSTRERLTQEIFSNIFRDRLMSLIREKMGATYNIAVSGELFYSKRPYQRIEIALDTDPKLVESVFEAIDLTLSELAEDGVTSLELTNTKLYFEKIDAERAKNGTTFISDMIKYVTSGEEDLIHDRAYELKDISTNDIKRIARRYHKDSNVIKSSFTPEIK